MRYLRPPPAARGIGVLLVNTGTPDSLKVSEVRRYLAAFLGDPRVIEAPRLMWRAVLHGWILRTRPRESAAKYARIWTPEGSPLLVYSQRLRAVLGQALAERGQDSPSLAAGQAMDQKTALKLESRDPPGFAVEIAMLYSRPGVAESLERLARQGCRRVLVLPLYPQYCGASTGAVHDQVLRALATWRRVPELRTIADYHDDPRYIQALRLNIQAHWSQRGRPGHVLFSFHGVPQSYVDNGDPYEDQCRRTAHLLAAALALTPSEWTLSFQSRLGRAHWLKPYTIETVAALPARGIRDLGLVCPGFPIDCLETLEEINMENRKVFLQAGGERWDYAPALNADPGHAAFLAELIARHCQGWM